MNKLFLAFCFIAISSVAGIAQSSDDYKKAEFYIGYSNNSVDRGYEQRNSTRTTRSTSITQFYEDRNSFSGFEVSAVGNVSRYIGIKGDVSGAYSKDDFNQSRLPATTITFNGKSTRYNFLAGVQFKDNSSESRVKPFVHVLVGAGYTRFNFTETTCLSTNNCSTVSEKYSETGLAGAFGGGLDIKLTDRIDLRLIQVDYNPIKIKQETQQNIRFGIGLVLK